MKKYSYALVLAAFMGATFYNVKDVRGELVYENELSDQDNSAVAAPAAQPGATIAVGQPTVTGNADGNKQPTKSELMRRQRMREELQNEDLLTQKLEELRLRDETKRTQDIMGSGIEKPQQEDAAVMTEQRVGSAAQDNKAAAAPTANALASTQKPGDAADATSTADANAVKSDEDQPLAGRISIMPRIGTSSMTSSIYNVTSKLAAGIDMSVDATDYIAFELGYTYASYNIAAGNSLYYPTGFNSGYLQTLSMNDNVIDLGVKANLLGPTSRVRPFVGAGLGYRRGYVNYNNTTQSYLNMYNSYGNQDVQVSGFSGYVETGLEFRLSKTLSLVGQFRYYDILSATQNNPINPYGFVGGQGYSSYAYSGYGYTNSASAAAGTDLAKDNFYQLSLGVAVSF